MTENNSILIALAKKAGADQAAIIQVDQIQFDPSLWDLCKMNACGNYGKNWTCPPCVGNIDQLIQKAQSFQNALVYQTISNLEDSFDYEGMVAASKRHYQITKQITKMIMPYFDTTVLQLAAGACPVCETCAKRDDMPCRFPERALASLESYGIHVSKLAESSQMKYINGQNTVTYFGAYLYYYGGT